MWPRRRLTLMRSPVVKGHTPPESGFFCFFPLWLRISVVSPWQRVLSSLPYGVHQRGCTTHFLRCARRCNDECRDCSVESLRPSNVSVPSDRPMQRRGSTCRVGQGEPGSGEGPPTQTGG